MDSKGGAGGSERRLTEKEQKLLELVRALEYGEIRIVIQNGEPLLVEEVRKSIKL